MSLAVFHPGIAAPGQVGERAVQVHGSTLADLPDQQQRHLPGRDQGVRPRGPQRGVGDHFGNLGRDQGAQQVEASGQVDPGALRGAGAPEAEQIVEPAAFKDAAVLVHQA